MENARGISVTLKADGGYDAPWIVFYGENAAEVAAKIVDAGANGLFTLVGNAAADFKAQKLVGAEMGATPANAPQQPAYTPPAQPQQPQGYGNPPQGYGQPQGGYQQPQQGGYQQPQQQAPQGPPGQQAPVCSHGTKRYVANGKYGPFWGCPAQRNDPTQCKPESAR